MFSGWGILSARNWAVTDWGNTPNYSKNIQDIYRMQNPGLFGTFAVLSPPIANFVRDEGFETVEKLTEFVAQPDASIERGSMGSGFAATSAAKPKTGSRNAGNDFSVVVTGATNNNYWMIGGMVPGQSVQIDTWR